MVGSHPKDYGKILSVRAYAVFVARRERETEKHELPFFHAGKTNAKQRGSDFAAVNYARKDKGLN